MNECKISTVRLNARNELSFKITVKQEDYSKVERELMKQADINWDLLDLKFTGLVSWDQEKQNKSNRVRLNWIMMTYCEKSGIRIEYEKERLYAKYKVSSRRDISPSDVESEIESYRVWLLEFN